MECSVGSAEVFDLKEYRDLRMIVQANIRAFIRKGTMQARIAMMETVAAVMRKYGKREMKFAAYTVTLVRIDGKDFPIIKSRRVADSCPVCGRKDDLLYVRTQRQNLLGPRDLVTEGCPDCGEIFARYEWNERSEEGA